MPGSGKKGKIGRGPWGWERPLSLGRGREEHKGGRGEALPERGGSRAGDFGETACGEAWVQVVQRRLMGEV